MDSMESIASDVNQNLLAAYVVLKDRGDIADLQRFTTVVSSTFLHSNLTGGEYRRDAIDVLCKIATAEDDSEREIGRTAIFLSLTEKLSDAFNPRYVLLCDRMFAQIIDFCRRLHSGKGLDFLLSRFGIDNERELLLRKAKRLSIFPISSREKIKRIFVLSRVTVGAEVAVTSVMLQKMKQTFPHARTVLLAPSCMRGLFSGDEAIEFMEVAYERHGSLLDRLYSWVSLVRILDNQRDGLRSGEFFIVDPDSRFTQLGLLPLTENDAEHYYYESRSFSKPGMRCISELTAEWLDRVFGPGTTRPQPYVALCAEDSRYGADICRRLRRGGARSIVTLNFGVGGNPEKKIRDSFEAELLCALLGDGNTLILDKGVGKEREEIDKLVAMLRETGRTVVELAEDTAHEPGDGDKISCDVLAWQGGIAKFGSLIACSQIYIGYDSAFQHVAAALEVPVIDVFADVRGPLFAERWQPYAKGIVRIVRADPAQRDSKKILDEVMACQREIRDLGFKQ